MNGAVLHPSFSLVDLLEPYIFAPASWQRSKRRRQNNRCWHCAPRQDIFATGKGSGRTVNPSRSEWMSDNKRMDSRVGSSDENTRVETQRRSSCRVAAPRSMIFPLNKGGRREAP